MDLPVTTWAGRSLLILENSETSYCRRKHTYILSCKETVSNESLEGGLLQQQVDSKKFSRQEVAVGRGIPIVAQETLQWTKLIPKEI